MNKKWKYLGLIVLILAVWMGAVYCDRQSSENDQFDLERRKALEEWQNKAKGKQIKDDEVISQDQEQQIDETPSQTRVDLPNGGYQIITTNPDGSRDFKTVEKCRFCNGTSLCGICGGAGGTMGRAYGGIFYPCTGCNATGRCGQCHGEGTITTYTHMDKDGNGTMMNSSGYVGSTSSAGTLVTSPDGRITAHPSGGGSSSTSSSSTRSDNNDYIETIEYAPNYTGEDNSVWCDKCQKVLPRHAHIRKRVR